MITVNEWIIVDESIKFSKKTIRASYRSSNYVVAFCYDLDFCYFQLLMNIYNSSSDLFSLSKWIKTKLKKLCPKKKVKNLPHSLQQIGQCACGKMPVSPPSIKCSNIQHCFTICLEQKSRPAPPFVVQCLYTFDSPEISWWDHDV